MSFNQSKSDKGETQYRKTGRSTSFNHNSDGGGGGGSYGRGGSGAASQLSGNRSFKKYSYNAQGGGQQPPKVGVSSLGSSGSSEHSGGVSAQCGVHNGAANQPPQSRGASNAPLASGVTKPTEQLATQGSTRPVVKAPSPQSSVGSSDAVAPKTPVKTAAEGSQPFQFQFGSISPGCMNGMQIPARTSSAPPNLDEQKRDQTHHAPLKPGPALPPSLPRHQLQRKEAVVNNQSGYGGGHQPTSQVKKDFQGSPAPSMPAPVTNQGQKHPHLPISGIPMQMPYAQPQGAIQYAGSQLQSQGLAAPSHQVHMQMPMPMPMGNAPQMGQQVFIRGLQLNLMQSQGTIHQGQSLTFANQIPQLPHHLGSIGFSPQYAQQQGENYGGQKKTVVKITDPKTREELKFDKHIESHTDGVSLGPKAHSNLPSQSQPITSFPTTHPANYYSSSNNPNMYFTAPSSIPISTSQITPNSQAPRLSYPVSQAAQNIPSNSSSHSYKDVKKAGSSVDNARVAINVASSTTLGTTQVASTGASGDKVLKSTVSTKISADVKIESPRQPPYEVSNSSQSQKDSATHLAVLEPKNVDSGSLPLSASAATILLPSSGQPVESFPGVTTEHRQKENLRISSSTEDQNKPGKKGTDSHQLAVPSSVSGDSIPESSREPLAGKDVSGLTEPESDFVNAGEGFKYVSSESCAFKSYGEASESAHLASPDDSHRKTVRAGDVPKESCSGYEETSKVAEFENKTSYDNVGTYRSTTAGFVDGKHVPSNPVSSVTSSGDNGLTLDDSLNLKDSKGSNEFSASSTDVSDICSIQGEGVEKSTAGEVSLTASESKDKPNSEPKRPTSARGKKKRKEILQKADAQGTNTDLYMAYKGPEEKKEDLVSLQGAENASGSITANHKPADAFSNSVAGDKVVQSKAEPDDWEDAADISSSELESSGKDQVQGDSTCHGENGDESIAKKYSRDFLLKFAEQFTSLPEGFEFTANVAGALVNTNINLSHHVDTGSFSPARIMDRQSGGPRLDRRGSSIGDDDRWSKVPSLHGNSTGFRPGGAVRNPRVLVASHIAGGILSGPMQNSGPYAGLQRYNSDADRWQRGANFLQKGLIPSPHTPLQAMHKAEKKYQVGKVTDEEEAKQRQLKGILNKLTPQNFEKLFEQVKAVNIDNVATLNRVISQIFDKALMEPTFCEMYANFCSHLAGELPDFSKENEKITFKILLLNKCQEEFERGEREQEEANKSEEGETKLTEEEREERRVKARRRMLGNIRLIGELYKKKMLTERIMHECIMKLLGQSEVPDEEDIEALCKLMATIGVMIDHSKVKVHMDAYFERMIMLSKNMELSSRVRFMLKDIVDLRKNRWQERRKVEGPKKIEEVHRDAAQERHLQSSRLTRGAGTSTSARRGASMDYGSRGPALSSPGIHMGGLRGLSPQVRGYGGAQDARFEERHTFEARTLSVPLHQRLMGDESITLGPQGGLARGMASGRGSALMSSSPLPGVSPSPGDSRRSRPGFNGYSSVSDRALYGTREDFGSRSMQDRYASQAAQESNLSYSNRDLQNSGRSSGRIVPSSPHVQGEQPGSVQIGPIENVQPEERLQNMSMAAIKEFYSARDEKEVALCVKDLNSPSFHPSMVSLWVMDAFERKDMERDLLAKLLVALTKSIDGALSQAQLVKGFESVLSTLEDAVTDAPRAPKFLGSLFAKVIAENVVSLNEVGQLLYEGGEEPGSLREAGLAADVLGSTLEAIKLEKGESYLNEILGSSNLRLEDFRPPDSYRSRKS